MNRRLLSLGLAGTLGRLLAYEAESFDDVCPECDGDGVVKITRGNRAGTEETQTCEACGGDGEAGLDLQVSGTDLVDAFTQWRLEIRDHLKEPATDAARIGEALEHLKAARDLLRKAGAGQTLERVRLAITSGGGALRHAQGKAVRS